MQEWDVAMAYFSFDAHDVDMVQIANTGPLFPTVRREVPYP